VVGRFLLDRAALARARKLAATVRDKQRRRHLDVGYHDDGAPPAHILLSLVKEVEGAALLGGALAAVEEALGEERLAGRSASSGAGGALVSLIIDRELESFPLEACGVLARCATARDFSLPLLHLRVSAAPNAGKGAADKSKLRFICDPRAEDRNGSNGTVARPEDFSTLCEVYSRNPKPETLDTQHWITHGVPSVLPVCPAKSLPVFISENEF
ncbi:hypothetical protein T484DRAFT_1786182, partial [Baffinella frigidus]